MVTATVTGITRPAISDDVQSRRKRNRMTQARIRPMKIASRTLRDRVAHQLRLIVERLQLHARRQILAQLRHFAATASATATVLLVGWRMRFSSTAVLPLAVTVV